MTTVAKLNLAELPPGFDPASEITHAAAWFIYKRDNNPPGMEIVDDLFDGTWRWRLSWARMDGPTHRSLAEARASAWTWHDRRRTLLADVDAARAAGATVPALEWPKVLELTNREGAEIRAALAQPRPIVFKVLHKTCHAAQNRFTQLVAPQPPLTTAEAAWKHHADGFADVTGTTLQRSHYLVIPCEVTGEKDISGREMVTPRWEEAR